MPGRAKRYLVGGWVDVELKKFGPPSFSGAPSKYFLVSKNLGGKGGGRMGRRFFGKNVPKIIFAIMGGSKYFSDLFRPQFQNTLRNSSIPGAPLGKLGTPSQVDFFGLRTA